MTWYINFAPTALIEKNISWKALPAETAESSTLTPEFPQADKSERLMTYKSGT